ncbi:MAG: hypothetical protein ACR5KW_03940 [Wolbachia sp.]
MSSVFDKGIKYFFYIPLLISKNKQLANATNGLHSILSYFKYSYSFAYTCCFKLTLSEFAIIGSAMSLISEKEA